MKPLANNKLMVPTKHVLRFILPPPLKKLKIIFIRKYFLGPLLISLVLELLLDREVIFVGKLIANKKL